MELEGGSKDGKKLEEGDRGGHIPIIGRRAIEKEKNDRAGHGIVICERNTVQVSALEARDTNSVTPTGYQYVCATRQLSSRTTSKSEQLTQSGQPLSCSVYLHKFFDLVR
jgi:hypothetical protein